MQQQHGQTLRDLGDLHDDSSIHDLAGLLGLDGDYLPDTEAENREQCLKEAQDVFDAEHQECELLLDNSRLETCLALRQTPQNSSFTDTEMTTDRARLCRWDQLPWRRCDQIAEKQRQRHEAICRRQAYVHTLVPLAKDIANDIVPATETFAQDIADKIVHFAGLRADVAQCKVEAHKGASRVEIDCL